MICEKCGHECDGDCTNCGGMAEGSTVCPVCDLLSLPAGNKFVLISDDPPVVVNWNKAGDLPVNEVVAAFDAAGAPGPIDPKGRHAGNVVGGDYWEYRVFNAGDYGVWLIEVFTDALGTVTSDCRPAKAMGYGSGKDPVANLRADLDRMRTAFDKPALTMNDFPGRLHCEYCGSRKWDCNC